MAYDNKSSAELEREVAEQRNRVENRLGEIRDRLSPGQLLDEALSYSKQGGAEFAGNLGKQISANPLPAALVGIGLAWLISSTMNPQPVQQQPMRSRYRDENDYPYARLSTGGVRRVRHQADEAGKWWSEFETDNGNTFRAQSDELGNRAGHFVDEAGKKFSGFIDDTGNRVRQFQDESGNRLDDALGWASHTWQDSQAGLGEQMQHLGSAAGQFGSNIASGTRQLGGSVQQQTDQMTRQITRLFDEQPLIAGALAFAAGAALGATLPHTAQEDQLLGEQADEVKRQASKTAGKLYQQGKQKAEEVYEDVADKAGQVYGETKDRVANLANNSTAGGTGNGGATTH